MVLKKRVMLKKSNFDSARISVHRGRLFGADKIEELANLKFEEVLRFLSENGFSEEVEKAYSRYQGFYLIEKVLNDHLSKIYNKVLATSSKDNKLLLDEYYFKYQVHNLMAFIRCKISKEEDITPYLIGSSRKKDKFLKAFEMNNLDEAISYLCKKLELETSSVIEMYKKSLYDLENYLYKTYYNRLNSYIFKYNSKDEVEFTKFIRKYVDLINARTFIKVGDASSDKVKFEEVYISGGNLNIDFFSKLSGSNHQKLLEEFSKVFSTTSNFEGFNTITELDKEISKHKEHGKKMFSKVRFGSPFYSLKYLFEVEREIAKLRIILKAKFLGLSKEEVLKLI